MSPEEAAEPGTVVREPQSAQGEQCTLGNLSPSPPALGGLSSLRSRGRQASFSFPLKLPRHWSKCEGGEVSGISHLSTSPRSITWSPDPETIDQVFLFLFSQLQAGFLAMCPPVNVRRGTRGMPSLFVSWLYQLVHGDQMKICFACFKEAFLVFRRMLETGDWVEEELGNASVELSEQGSDPDAWLGLELTGFQSYGYLPQTVPVSAPVWPAPQPVPTELRPEEAVPLDLGPEIDDWTQALPLRLGIFSSCLHRPCIIPPLSWCGIVDFNPYPGQPVLLELSPIWPMQLLVDNLLECLKFVTVLGSFDNICYLLTMRPCFAVRTQVHRWQMLLDPGELRKAYLQNEPKQPDLYRWRLSVLESSELGVELVPADCSLGKGGFKVHSYLPWESDIPDDWSTDPGERLFIKYIEPERDLSYSLHRHFIDNFTS